MLSSLPTSLRAALNRANLQSLPPAFQKIAIGDVLRGLHVALYNQAPLAAAGNPYVIQTASSVYLPDDAKALAIVRAYARAGTSAAGPLTVDSDEATLPATLHCAVAPSGDLVFNATDAWTAVDVFYQPQRMDVVELNPISVASNAVVLPANQEGLPAVYFTLLEVESLAGINTGKFVVGAPAATNSTAKSACFNLAKTQVIFDSADAVTSCRLKLGIQPLVNLNALLEAASNFI
jgi:hypothetical protein